MAEYDGAAKSKNPSQQEGGEDDGYYDIMVIGKTGMGKSTTVDKLLIADISSSRRHDVDDIGPTYDPKSGKLTHKDLVMWIASDTDGDTATRLKNILFARALTDSHREIDRLRNSEDLELKVYRSTSQCELLSNESTKIRVLDVPGFFGENEECDDRVCNVEERAQDSINTDLSIMRKIIRISITHHLNFKRIVYFLPDKGKPKRVSQNLKLEIAIMEQYFGRSIFDSMVVVATRSTDSYELASESNVDESKMNFSPKDLGIIQGYLQKAIQSVFKSDAPEPPVISISLFDTCEDIFLKIMRTQVKQESIQLAFNKSRCTRCGIAIYYEARGNAQNESEELALCSYSGPSEGILLDESTCHPMMVPKYTKAEKIVGGIVHLITLRRFLGRWPSFETMDEKCLCCQRGPGRGCLRVGSKFSKFKEEIIVAHSSSVAEPYEFEVVEGEDETEDRV